MAVNINIKLEKKQLYLLAAVMVFLVGVVIVIATGSGSPNTMGHSIDEISDVQQKITGSCSGSVMVGIDANNAVICETDDVGGGGGAPGPGRIVGSGSHRENCDPTGDTGICWDDTCLTYGVATCSGSGEYKYLDCPAGTTIRLSSAGTVTTARENVVLFCLSI